MTDVPKLDGIKKVHLKIYNISIMEELINTLYTNIISDLEKLRELSIENKDISLSAAIVNSSGILKRTLPKLNRKKT